jgi:hypothetical protein
MPCKILARGSLTLYSLCPNPQITALFLIPADEKKAFEQLIKSYRKKHIRTSHNIIVVAYSWISESDSLASMRNIISFEDYLLG